MLLESGVEPEPGPDTEPDAEPDAAIETRELHVTSAQHGQRLDKVLVSMAPEFPRSHLQGLIDRALMRVDGEVAATASRRSIRHGATSTAAAWPRTSTKRASTTASRRLPT